jgi:hypothetical protein
VKAPAVWLALAAIAIASAALTVALTRPAAPDPYRLVCGEAFHDAQTGQSVPMYVPCSARRPRP